MVRTSVRIKCALVVLLQIIYLNFMLVHRPKQYGKVGWFGGL